MRVALAGALLSGADHLVLDEPSNHLDRESRQALAAQLQRWPGGLVVVSHDRSLLQGMERIDRKSTRLNSSHLVISYAVFCLKKKKNSEVTHNSTHATGAYHIT